MDGKQIGALIYIIVYTFALFPCIGLFVFRFIYKPYWTETVSDTKQTVAARRVLFACALCYIIASIFIYIGLIMFIPFGFDPDSPTATIYSIFAMFYTLSLFFMLYVWIQRIKTTFTGSAYEYSRRFLTVLKYIFWLVIIFALVTLVLFITNDGGDDGDSSFTVIVAVMAGIFAIGFCSLIATILYTFISRLNHLRKVAEDRLSKISDVGDYDFDSLEVIQKLIKLQLKLTISCIVAIVSTLCAIMLVIEFDQEFQFMIYGTDTIIGFICMYCTIKINNDFYEKLCKLCIITCDCCFNTTEIDNQANHHIAIHSRSMQSSTNNNSGGSGGSGGGQPSAITMTTEAASGTRELQTITATDQPTPRPSTKHAATDSLPVDNLPMSNNESTNMSVVSETNEITMTEDQ